MISDNVNKQIMIFFDLNMARDHICHKQYKQRLCKIIITRVKVHFVDVF